MKWLITTKHWIVFVSMLLSAKSHAVFWCEFEPIAGEYYSGSCESYSGGIRAQGHGILKGKQFEYDGDWRRGVWHGQGTLKFTSGEKYVGRFKEGEFYYFGTYTWPDQSEYVGQFEDNKRNGHGVMTYGNGDRYVGDFVDGERHGQGTYTWFWFPKNKNVEGIIKLIHGTRNIGEWRNGKEWNIKKYDRFGEIIGSWTNGIYQFVRQSKASTMP